MSRNLAASIRARLKQHADAAKQDFNLTLTYYGLERLLYRLSISAYALTFLLKDELHGHLYIHLGDDSAFRAVRLLTAACKHKSD